jgi:hypothetical protein
MATRKAILIANPGEVGTDSYCEGVNKDMQNYFGFLTSAFGGSWYTSEISKLEKPSKTTVLQAIQGLRSVDYSLVVFCGHGWYSAANQSTFVDLSRTESMDSKELRRGSQRQTLILDCCRKVEGQMRLDETIMAKATRAASMLDPNQCRRYYDKRIEECATGLVVMHSCDIDETAGDDSSKGGYYSYNVIRCAEQWVELNTVDVSKEYGIFSVVSAHDSACPHVHDISGGRQHPQIEKHRSDKYFPFAVMA